MLMRSPKKLLHSWRRRRELPSLLVMAMSGGHTAWQMRALAGADAVLKIKDADVALTGLYQGGRRMKLTYPILKRSRRCCGS
jgi:hypothetical protein